MCDLRGVTRSFASLQALERLRHEAIRQGIVQVYERVDLPQSLSLHPECDVM